MTRRLNGVDALMLVSTAAAPTTTLKISVLDPSTDPTAGRGRRRQIPEERAHLLPESSGCGTCPPLAHHPIWVEDPEFPTRRARAPGRLSCPGRDGGILRARRADLRPPADRTARCGRPAVEGLEAAASPRSRCRTTPTLTASACWTCSPRSTTTRLTRPPWLRPVGAAAAAAVHLATPGCLCGTALQARQDRADRAGRS